MKTSLRLFFLLIFLYACDSAEKARTAEAKPRSREISKTPSPHDSIPAEYSITDSIPAADSLAAIEPKNPLEYMAIEEKGMIDEINLLRGDPQAYTRFIDEYIHVIVNDPAQDNEVKRTTMTAATELIAELSTMEPLPSLRPHYRLYQVAKLHAQDMKSMKKIASISSDGAHPFQRIYDGAGLNGSENLIEGKSSVRESIISLLIGSSGANRFQKQNLLNPDWEFITCYEAGTIGESKNIWVQLFGITMELEEEDVEMEADDMEIEEADIAVEIEEEPAILEEPEVTEVAPVAEPAIEPEPAVKEPAFDFSFMTPEEKEMIEEINRLRSNPEGYIPFLEAYAAKYESQYRGDEDFGIAVNELKEQLKNMQPLSQLRPHQALYNVAKSHGLDNKTNNKFEHIGSDGSDPFERVKRSGLKNFIDDKGFFAPNENLVGGENTPRESVVALLIDAGVKSRGHRKALLNPKWKYVACYKIGRIENIAELKGQVSDDMNNCWVQLFALD